MAFKIATNVASLNTQNALAKTGAAMNQALERLSSGYKINHAADDAAGKIGPDHRLVAGWSNSNWTFGGVSAPGAA